MYTYISNQDIILDKISNAILSKVKLSVIRGASGTGKSFLLGQILAHTHSATIYKLEGDFYLKSKDYYPFLYFINSRYISSKKVINRKIVKDSIINVSSQLGSWAPLGNDFLSTCIQELSNLKKCKKETYNYIFEKDDLDILFPLEYFCSSDSDIIFMIDDIQYWDQKSIALLYALISQQDNENVFLKKVRFIVTINTDYSEYPDELNGIIKLAYNNLYDLNIISKKDYSFALKRLGLKIDLKQEITEALYSITGGNLQLSTDIVLLLNNDQTDDITDTIEKIVSEQNLGHLLIERLKKVDSQGSMINETLKYASLFGTSFYYHDLKQILQQSEGVIRNLIKKAQNFCLVNGNINGASFIHEIIREAYKNETQENKAKYYIGYAKCLKILYPSKYKERAQVLRDAEEYEHAAIIIILEFLKQLRTNNSCSPDLRKQLNISKKYLDFAESMEEAYNLFFDDEYEQCLYKIDQIEDIYPPELLAEKNYLLSITLSKWLDSKSRKRAVNCLVPYLEIDSINNEIEIWERIVSAYIIACIHTNHYELAQEYETKLYISIKRRIDFDIDASYKLNIIRRKATSLHPPRQALSLIKKSKDFFAPKETGGMPLDPIEYYMSLNNFLAASLMNGKYEDALKSAAEISVLPKDIGYLKFPRFEMPLNNAVLIFYLNDKLTEIEAYNCIQQILDAYKMEESTEIIIKVNRSIFEGLCGNHVAALETLTDLHNKIVHVRNLEFYYKYLVEVNLLVFKFLNTGSIPIDELEELRSECIDNDENYLELHSEAIINSLKDSDIDSFSYDSRNLHIDDRKSSDDLTYYTHKYLFGELEFWSES